MFHVIALQALSLSSLLLMVLNGSPVIHYHIATQMCKIAWMENAYLRGIKRTELILNSLFGEMVNYSVFTQWHEILMLAQKCLHNSPVQNEFKFYWQSSREVRCNQGPVSI